MRITPATAPTWASGLAACAALLLCPSLAQAAARAIVLPVVVGAGTEPPGNLMSSLAKGLQDNPGWMVVEGSALKGLMAAPPGLKEEDRARLKTKIDQAVEKGGKEAVTELEAVRLELSTAAKDLTLTDAEHELSYRAATQLVAAHQAAGSADTAKDLAAEVAAQFPGRKVRESDKLPSAAADLLASTPASGGVKMTFKSRPENCEVFVNGNSVGKAPVELPGSLAVAYQAHAVCPGTGAGAPLKSYPRRVLLTEKDTNRQEVLDAEFEKTFEADGGQRLRFASSPDRRALEDGYARRVAERYGADAVILASVGELSGADWLNARLYLSSGYLNRQALVRLEPGRALALGRYLATGRDAPGVLKPEEAGQLVASSQASAVQARQASPWYTDIVGWCFTGVGAVGVTLGYLANREGQRTSDEADAIRGNSERQMSLWRDAEKSKFLGGIGMIGGGLMAVTGIVLLAIPEYQSTQSELFVFTPARGGGTLSLRGRF